MLHKSIIPIDLISKASGLTDPQFVIPVAITGGALAWVNLGLILSLKASEDMQGRALGGGGAIWSIGQFLAPIVAGPLLDGIFIFRFYWDL